MKKLDFIIIVVLIIISFIPQLIFAVTSHGRNSKLYAEITVKGSVYKKIQLQGDLNQSVIVTTELGTNKVQIRNGKVSITEADCPDKICIKAGEISKSGEILVCLPHKLIVEIKGENEKDIDGLSY